MFNSYVSTHKVVRAAFTCLSLAVLATCSFAQSLSSISIKPTSINGGSSAGGTITISKKAPAGGFVVNLASSQTFASVPASVTIPTGSTKATFSISTFALSATETVKISATAASVSKSATLTVTAAPLYLVTVFPESVSGGSVSIGTVSLDGIAPAAGTTVALSSNSAIATVPSSVTVPSGYSFATFVVATTAVASTSHATITARLGHIAKSTVLTVSPAALGNFTLYPSSVVGGTSSVGTVSLTGTAPKGGYQVWVSSSNPGVAEVPTPVTIPAGQSFTTFNITTKDVNPSSNVVISVSADGVGLSQDLSVLYLSLGLLTVSPGTVVGGASSTGTISLSGAAPAEGFSVELSSNSSTVSVPSTVWIPSGSRSASFNIATAPVATYTPTTITAAAGAAFTTASLNLGPASISGLTFSQPSVAGGTSVTGTVGLSSPAPANYTVSLTSSDPSVTVPSSLTFTAGATSASFVTSTIPVALDTPVNIYAAANNLSVGGSLLVTSPRVQLLTLNPSAVIAGVPSYGTVSLTSPAPSGFNVLLSSNNNAVVVPSTLGFASGSTFATFTAQTTPVATNQQAVVTASINAISASTTLLVTNGLSGGQGLDLTSPWPKFHGNAQNTGLTENAIAATDWAATIGSPIITTPAVGLDGTIYFGANNGYVYALNPLTGAILWQTKTGGRVSASPVISGKGILYVGSTDSSMYAINIANGGVLWTYKTAAPITATAAVGADGNVYFGSTDSYVYALNQSTGTVTWAVKTKGPIESSPTLSTDGTLFVGSNDFHLYAIDTVTATISWSYATGGAVESSPAISNGMVYFGSEDNNFYAVDALNGVLVWTQPTGWSVYSSPCVDAVGNVYVGSEDSILYAFNGATGAILWTYATGDIIDSSPAVDGAGNVYVGSDDGKLYEISTSTGTLVYSFNQGSELQSAPVIVGPSTVLIGTGDGNLLHKNLSVAATSGWSRFRGNNSNTGQSSGFGATGFQKWATSNVGGTSSPSIGADGTIYSTYLNNLYAINYRTGVIDWVYQGTGGWTASTPAVGPDGTLYLGSGDTGLYAINGRTGTLKWRYATGSQIVSSPVIGGDGTVYFGSNDNNVYAVNGQTGTLKWKFTTQGPIESSPALSGNGTIYVGSDDSNLYAINSQSGALVWVFGTGNKVQSSPVIGPDGTIYIGSSDTNVYAVNGLTGSLIWTFGTGNAVVSTPALGVDGTLYITSTDGFLYSLESKSAALNWQYNTGTSITSSPVLAADGTVYFGFSYAFGNANNFFALNGKSGKVIWSLNVPTVSASPAIGADGTLYLGSILGTGNTAISQLIAIH